MMSTNHRSLLIAAAAVAAVQSAALGWMIAGRVSLLKSGREMTVEVVPVDPRDIFRGEYVILGYTFSGTGDTPLPAGTRVGDAVYADLKQGEGTKWDLVSVSSKHPDKVEPGHAVLKGIASYIWTSSEQGAIKGRIQYGIENYFVPEGEGHGLEEKVRDKKIDAILAVSASGEAAIKAIAVDGQRVHEEALF